MKWRLAYRAMCDKIVSPSRKGKFYKVVVRPILLWSVKNTHVQKMKVAEMRMLR